MRLVNLLWVPGAPRAQHVGPASHRNCRTSGAMNRPTEPGYGSRRATAASSAGHSRPTGTWRRVVLTESTSNAWDTRVDRPRVLRRNPGSAGEGARDHAGRHSARSRMWGCLRPPRVNCRIRARSSWSHVRWLVDHYPTVFLTGSSSKKRTSATPCTADPTGKTPWSSDLRRCKMRLDRDQLATELVSKLLAGLMPGDGAHGAIRFPARYDWCGPVTWADFADESAAGTAARERHGELQSTTDRTAGNYLPHRCLTWPGPIIIGM